MNRILLLNAVLLFILLQACSTTYHYAEFIRPSDTYIPSSIYVVGMVNRGASPENVAPLLIDGLPYEYLRGLPKTASDKTLSQLSKQVEEIGRYSVINIENEGFVKDPGKFASEVLSTAEVDSICKRYELDGLLSLDAAELAIRSSGEIDVVTVNDATGMPVRVPEFSKESQVDYTVLWRFHSCESNGQIDDYQETYQRFFSQIVYSEDEITRLKPEDMRLIDIAAMAANDYAERIAPHWKEDYRRYYVAGSEKLNAIAQDLYFTGDWELAAQRWKDLSISDNAKERYRAAFNMAVASEILGRPRLAKEWINKAIAIDPSRLALDYRKNIDKQILIYEVVNRQLGIKD